MWYRTIFIFLVLSGFSVKSAELCSDQINDQSGRLKLSLLAGLVTDTKSGLMWYACPLGQAWSPLGTCTGVATPGTWKQTTDRAEEVSHAAYSDWRVPSLKEMASVMLFNCPFDGLNTTFFPQPTLEPSRTKLFVWTSTASTRFNNNAWVYNLSDGGRLLGGVTNSSNNTYHSYLVRATGNKTFPVKGEGWSNVLGSDCHYIPFYDTDSVIGRNIYRIKDRFAADLNLPNDADKGRSVYAVASGELVAVSEQSGGFIIKHESPIQYIENGLSESLRTWYSSYLHMNVDSNLLSSFKDGARVHIDQEQKLGTISNVGAAGVNHLHFGVYKNIDDGNTLQVEIESIDFINLFGAKFRRSIVKYDKLCGRNNKSTSTPFWNVGDDICGGDFIDDPSISCQGVAVPN